MDTYKSPRIPLKDKLLEAVLANTEPNFATDQIHGATYADIRRYFEKQNWDIPGNMSDQLRLLESNGVIEANPLSPLLTKWIEAGHRVESISSIEFITKTKDGAMMLCESCKSQTVRTALAQIYCRACSENNRRVTHKRGYERLKQARANEALQ